MNSFFAFCFQQAFPFLQASKSFLTSVQRIFDMIEDVIQIAVARKKDLQQELVSRGTLPRRLRKPSAQLNSACVGNLVTLLFSGLFSSSLSDLTNPNSSSRRSSCRCIARTSPAGMNGGEDGKPSRNVQPGDGSAEELAGTINGKCSRDMFSSSKRPAAVALAPLERSRTASSPGGALCFIPGEIIVHPSINWWRSSKRARRRLCSAMLSGCSLHALNARRSKISTAHRP